MNRPSFSIIVPVYNVEEYIIECLESVAAQDYDGPVECIIVDDRGSDRSIELAQDFIDKYNDSIDFRIIVREQNGGLSAARNTGIRAAKGEYITFLDSDDMLTPNCLSILAEYAIKYSDAQIIQGRAIQKENNIIYGTSVSTELKEYYDDSIEIMHIFLKSNFFTPAWSKAIKTSFIKDNDLYFKNGILHEDNFWQLAIAPLINELTICNDTIYIYRIRPNSITQDKNNIDKSIDSLFALIKIGLDNYSIIKSNDYNCYIRFHILLLYSKTINNKYNYSRFKQFISNYFNVNYSKINIFTSINLYLFNTCPGCTTKSNIILRLKNILYYKISHFTLLNILNSLIPC